MDEEADRRKKSEEIAQTIRGKKATAEFDVFLSYKTVDRDAVEGIAKSLVSYGVLPWFDKWEIEPGARVSKELESQIQRVKSAAVFLGTTNPGTTNLGTTNLGDWQSMEVEAYIRNLIKRRARVIPVFLKNAPQDLEAPPFLANLEAVDFRVSDPSPLQRLIWGITGKSMYWSESGFLSGE